MGRADVGVGLAEKVDIVSASVDHSMCEESASTSKREPVCCRKSEKRMGNCPLEVRRVLH